MQRPLYAKWQGSRVFMRERRVLKRVKWFVGPSRQFVRPLPLHTCQPTATPESASWYLDDSFTSACLHSSPWIAGLYIPFTSSPRRRGRTPTSRCRSSLRPSFSSSGSTTSSSTGMRNPWEHFHCLHRSLTPMQRPAARECAPPKILLRRQYWRPDQIQRGVGASIGHRASRDNTIGSSCPSHQCCLAWCL